MYIIIKKINIRGQVIELTYAHKTIIQHQVEFNNEKEKLAITCGNYNTAFGIIRRFPNKYLLPVAY